MKRTTLYFTFLILHFSFAMAQVQPFALSDVRLLPSRFQRNMQRDSAWIASIPVSSLLHSFRNTAGVFSDKEGGYMTMHHLAGWESLDCDLRGHITGHLLSAMAYLSASSPASAPAPASSSVSASAPASSSVSASVPAVSTAGLRAKADSLICGLAEVQRQYGTGYLSAFGEGLIDRNIQGKSVWAPFYTLHKILQGLIDQYVMCGNETALQVARGMGDWAYNKLRPLDDDTRRRMLRNEFGGFNDAMYQLYAITRDERHLWVARFFYHNEKIDPLKAGNSDLGTNHANTFIPKLLGECRNYELFGDESSLRAATLLYNTLVRDHAFVTGEVSDKEHLFRPETQSKHLTGYDGENCCTYNLLKLADRLFCYQPDSRIADYYERALYNHILGQQDTLSSMVCYFTPLMTGGYRLYSTRDSSFWCCVGSGFESHAKYQSSIYFHTANALYVNLFIPSELHWNGTLIRQTTSFPASNTTTLTISPSPASPSASPSSSLSASPSSSLSASPSSSPSSSPSAPSAPVPCDLSQGFTLRLRYPYWASYMKLNGRKVKPAPDGYVSLPCSLFKGPVTIEVEFGMTLREEPTKDDPSRVALMYGPIVLAGRLSDVPHPFSNPKKYNDYYTFDYGQHPDIPLGAVKHLGGLHFESDGITIQPFYDMQRCRYVVYWKK